MNDARGSLFVIAAPSGVGKSTLTQRLLAETDNLTFSISHTTRAPRRGERDGREYHFTDDETFRRMVAGGAFVEWAEVHGRYYGTAREQVERELAAGRDLLLDIDVQGAAQVRASGLPAELIFVMPPDYASLERRLRGRQTEDAASFARRLSNAAREIRAFEAFDYVVINDELDSAAAELAAIVRATRCRMARRKARGRAIVATFPPAGQDG